MHLALKDPEVAKSLTLINLVVESATVSYGEVYDMVLGSLRKSCRDDDHEIHENSMSATWGQLVGRAESGSQTEEMLENLLVDGFEAIDNGVLARHYPYLESMFTRNQVDLLKSEQIGRVQCPVLFIFTDMDDFHSQGYVDYLDAIESRNMSTDQETFGRGAMGGDRLSVARSHHTPRADPDRVKTNPFPPSGDRRSSSKSGQRTPSVFSPLRGRFDPAIRKEDTTAVDLVKVEVTVEVEVIADGVRYGAGDFRPGPSGISVGE